MSASEESAVLIVTSVVDAWKKKRYPKERHSNFKRLGCKLFLSRKDICKKIMTGEAVECESDIHPRRDCLSQRGRKVMMGTKQEED